MNLNKTITIIIVLTSLSIILASTSASEAKSKVTIVLNDYGCYKGKVKATLKNVDLGITFFKNKVISLKHDHAETFKYNAGNSLYYDELSLKITQGQNSWTSVEHWKENLRIDASVEEIDDCGFSD